MPIPSLRFKKQDGFSVAEILVAMGIATIVVLAAAGGMSMMSKSNKKAMTDGMDIGDMATAGVAFPAFVQLARPSVQFLHTPVNKLCNGDDTKPCLRMDTTDGFVELDASTAAKIGANTVEFFRDHDGRLRNDLKVAKTTADSSAANVTYTAGLNLSKLPSGHTVHVTWPLINENSAPFLMVASNTVAKYTVPGYEAISSATPSDWLFLKLDSGQLSDVSKLMNSPIAFVNTLDTRQFVIKDIVDVHSCADAAWSTQCATAATNASYVTPNDIIVKYATISASNLSSMLASSIAPPSDGSFDSGLSSLSQFPNISTTLVDEEAVYFSGTNYDPRRILHYYHSSGVAGTIAALPVGLVSLHVTRRAGTNTLDLVRDVYRRGQSPIRGTISADLHGPVLIARKLGSEEIKMILFDSPTSP